MMLNTSELLQPVMERVRSAAEIHGVRYEHYLAHLLEDALNMAEVRAAERQSEARYRALLESQLDFVCRYAPDTTLTYVNQAYCDFFGMSREQLIGNSFLQFVTSEEVETALARIRELHADPSPRMLQFHRYDPNGDSGSLVMWMDYGIVDENGKLVEVQAVGRDITAQQLVEKQAVYARQLELELAKERELIEIKEQMISALSHEFRTPLSVIQTSVDILEKYMARLTPEQILERFGIVRGQVKQMVTLMEDLLIYGRLSASRDAVNRKRVDIGAVMMRVCDDLLITDKNKHNLRVEVDPGLGSFRTDETLIERIVVNLLTNALKYSPEHSTVTLALSPIDGGIQFRVTDQGIGIPEDYLPRLFEPFHRAANVGSTKGTGLGLSIVKSAVDALDGTITVQTSEQTGTTFVVTLPS